YYTVEVRRRAGYDSHAPEEGVVIHRVDESTFNSAGSPPHFEKAAQCVPPPNQKKSCWSPGQTFSDPQAGIKIAIVEEDSSGCKVQVTVDPATTSPGVVTNTRDQGAGSLRDALSWAQRRPDSKIRFAIPRTDPNLRNGVYHIVLE